MKNKIITLVALLTLVFSGCSMGKNSTKNNSADQNQQENMANQLEGQSKNNASENETMTESEDKIPFKDPGSDELGKEIQEMDSLINQTAPSEYGSENLTDEALETEVEAY